MPWPTGNNFRKGKKHSDASKRKMIESRKLKGHYNSGKHLSEKTKKKIGKAMKGFLHPMWKGGITKDGKGYVLILKPDHPRSNGHGYVKRSRLVMEQHLGRYLEPKEIPHHKNEVKDDDRIENLRLFASPGEHISFHNHLRKLSLRIDGC